MTAGRQLEFWLAEGILVAREGQVGGLGSSLRDGIWCKPSVREGLLPSAFDTSRQVPFEAACRMGWDPAWRSLADIPPEDAQRTGV